MSSTIPEIQSIKIISETESVIVWNQSSSSDVGVKGYNLYRGEDPSLISTIYGRSSLTYTDSGLSFGNTYTYRISSFDINNVESGLSEAFIKEFSQSKFVLDQLETYLRSHNAQNLTLIVNQEEIPILTAMEENIHDVVAAIDSPVHFDTQFRENIEDNITSFWYIPMNDLWGYSMGFPYAEQTLRNRRFFGDTAINNRLANIFQRIYQDANYFYSL